MREAYFKPSINFYKYTVNVLTEKETCHVTLVYELRGFRTNKSHS